MARLAFSTQITRKINTRDKPDKYNKSLYRNIMRDLGPGDHLSDVYYPYKYLPAMMKDVSTEDYIAIVKGRAVSLLTHFEASSPASGIPTPSGASSIYVAPDYTTSGAITSVIDGDNSFWGYPNHVAGLLVPANGGTACSGHYTTRDVAAKWLQGVSNLLAAPVITKNVPIGVIPGDVYQDIRGAFLNYQMWDKAVSVVTDWYIEVPYVKISHAKIDDTDYNPGAPTVPGTADKYDEINSKYTYLVIDENDLFQAGVPVAPDTRGNYKLINGSTAITTALPNWTTQCVGKLVLTDCRYPKDLLELVDTYGGSNMPGTDTAGIPAHIFNFAHDYLVARGLSNRLADVATEVQAGMFGGARILINI